MQTTTLPDIELNEYATTAGVELDPSEAATIAALRTIDIRPSTSGGFDLNPLSTVGSIALGERVLRITPKVPLGRLLFLISYALDPVRWDELLVPYDTAPDITGAMAAALVSSIRSALRGGVLQGYRAVEETARTVRGRIRFSEQLRRHSGSSYPIEIGYDDFTTDINENRLLLAALWRISRVDVRSESLRAEVARQRTFLADCARWVDFDPDNLPDIAWTSLNRRYRPAVTLAGLVLRSTTIEQGSSGTAQAAGLLVNMNTVFEEFVRTALRQELGLSASEFPRPDLIPPLHLDERRRIGLDPDLSLWRGGRCRFVGDVKYKRLTVAGIKHPDLYQLLSYVIATDLPGGLLVYPVAEHQLAAAHHVVHLGRRLQVTTIDIGGTVDDILGSVCATAEQVQALLDAAPSASTSSTF